MEIVRVRLENRVKRHYEYAVVAINKDGSYSKMRIGLGQVYRTEEDAKRGLELIEAANRAISKDNRWKVVKIDPSSYRY